MSKVWGGHFFIKKKRRYCSLVRLWPRPRAVNFRGWQTSSPFFFFNDKSTFVWNYTLNDAIFFRNLKTSIPNFEISPVFQALIKMKYTACGRMFCRRVTLITRYERNCLRKFFKILKFWSNCPYTTSLTMRVSEPFNSLYTPYISVPKRLWKR